MSHTGTRAVALAAAVGLLLLPLVGRAQNQGDPFVNGVELVRSGDYAQAEALLKTAVQQAPENGAAWLYLGIAQFRQGNYSDALQSLIKARDLNPGRPGPTLYIGEIYERQGACEEALQAYQRELVFRRGRDEAEVHTCLGRAYFRLGRYDDCLRSTTTALRTEPRLVEAMFWQGLALTELKRFEDAERAFQKARQALEEWSDAKKRLERKPLVEEEGLARAATEPKVAQEHYWAEQFASVLSMWPELNKAMGDLYLRWGDHYPEARNAYRRGLDPNEGGNADDPDVFVRVAEAYLQEGWQDFEQQSAVYTAKGTFEEAIKSANKAIEVNAKYAPAYAVLGRIYAAQARAYVTDPERGVQSHTFDEAIEQHKKALALDPNYVPSLMGIADAYLGVGDSKPVGSAEAAQAYAEAVRHMEKAVNLAPRDPEVRALLARAYLVADRLDEALVEAEDALKLDPNNHTALNVIGAVYYYRGDLASAAAYFERAAKVNPNHAQTYINLGNTYFQMQSWHRARQAYRRALQLTPAATIANTSALRARLHYTIALCHDHVGDYQPEIEELSKAIYLDDAFVDAYLQMGQAYEATEDFRAAEQALRIAAQKAGTDEDRVRAYVQLGQLLERAGRPADAVAAYTAAAALDAENPIVQDALQRLRAQTPAASG
ncbi:MAG: tetratricopeptide repeat protein [Armatimonadetes bacterium]|nr:tetratricopeptide repeat protein [Armatimonadota bacterium]